jgi:hypothetical protein
MDTKLFGRHQPGGLFSIVDREDFPTGTIWWVGSTVTGASDTAGYGQNPDAPFATLAYAVNTACAAGDTIFLLPGHAEALAAATTLVMDLAGVTVIGLGVGTLQPLFSIGTLTTATFSITAANCRLKNLGFVSTLADVAAGITLSATADGATIEDCLFYDTAVNLEMKLAISIAALCTNVTIKRCRFFSHMAAATGATVAAIWAVGAADYLTVEECFIHGHYIAGAIDISTAASVSVLLKNNAIINIDTDAGLCININAATTGFAVGNHGFGLMDTVHFTAAAMAWSQNFDSNALNASAIIKPAVDS